MLDNGSNSKSRFAPTGYPVPSLNIGGKEYYTETSALNAIKGKGYSEKQLNIASRYSNGLFQW